MVKNENNNTKSKPSAKRLKKLDFDKMNKEFEKKEISREIFSMNVSTENYRKLNAISATKNIPFEKIINPLLDEKIMNINVVEYVENISDIDLVKFRYSNETIGGIKLSSESDRRLKIFAGVKNVSINKFIESFVDEIINNIDLLSLIKEEFN